MLENRYISNVLKQKLEEAVRVENSQAYDNPNVCNRYQCTMVFQPKKVQPSSSPTKHYFIRTFDNHITDNGKGNEYLNHTNQAKHRPNTIHSTEKRDLQYGAQEPKRHNPKKHSPKKHSPKNHSPKKHSPKKHNLSQHDYSSKPKEVNQAKEEEQVTYDGTKEDETHIEVFGPDPRFPAFPTFPSFPNFPEFPEAKKH